MDIKDKKQNISPRNLALAITPFFIPFMYLIITILNKISIRLNTIPLTIKLPIDFVNKGLIEAAIKGKEQQFSENEISRTKAAMEDAIKNFFGFSNIPSVSIDDIEGMFKELKNRGYIENYRWIEQPQLKAKIGVEFEVNKKRFLKVFWSEADELLKLASLKLESSIEVEKQQIIKEIVKNLTNQKENRYIKFNEKEGKFEVMQNGEAIDSFVEGGYKERILKILVKSKKPLKRKEIEEKLGRKDGIPSFSTYINRLKEILMKYGFTIVCEKDKYQVIPS